MLETVVTSGIVVSSMRDLTFHTRFFFEDFEIFIFFAFVDLLDDTLVFERLGLKIVPSDLAIKTYETVRGEVFWTVMAFT